MNVRYHFRPLIACLLLLFVFSILPVFAVDNNLEGLDSEAIKIDFDDVIEESRQSPENRNRPVLKIAVAAMISPQNTYRYYVDLVNLIAQRMNRDVEFVQKKTYAQVNEMLKRNALDLAFVCSGPYVSGRDEFGMQLVAVPVCHGEKVYYSYFIASAKSGIGSFDDFRGKTFVFTDPLSNSGYMVPTYYLALRGESPESYFGKTFFTNSHDNSIQAVADGLADGAAVDSLIYEFMKVRQPELTENTVVVEKSDPYGIPPVVAPPSASPEMMEQLMNIFLTIHETSNGRKILDNIQVDRFVRGDDRDYDTVRDLRAFLKSQQP